MEVKIYRAITGKGIFGDGKYIHSGVSDNDLDTNGIFCSNHSYAQYNSMPGSVGSDLRVPGLPIYFNFNEAVFWLKSKLFNLAPAIVESRFPLDVLNDNFIIVRNYWEIVYGKILTPEDIMKHLTQEQIIAGDFLLIFLWDKDVPVVYSIQSKILVESYKMFFQSLYNPK